MNKLLRILTAIFAVTTAILGFASYAEALPKEYAAVVGLITAILLGVKEIVVVIGDIADDGQRNGSFKPDGRKVLSVLLLVGLSALALCSVGCSHLSVTQRQAITRTVVPLSQLGLSLAQSRGVIQEGDKILIGDGLALILDDAASTRDKVVKLSALGVQAAVERGVLKEGDALIIQQATAIIQSAAESEVILKGPEPSAPTSLKNNPSGSSAEAESSGQSRACGLLNPSPSWGASNCAACHAGSSAKRTATVSSFNGPALALAAQ